MKRIIVLGPLATILVLGSLLLPSSVPGRSANERLEHGLPIPFIRQKLVDGPIGPGPWAYRGPILAPQEVATEVSEPALLADIVIVAIGLWLVSGLLSRRRRRWQVNRLDLAYNDEVMVSESTTTARLGDRRLRMN